MTTQQPQNEEWPDQLPGVSPTIWRLQLLTLPAVAEYRRLYARLPAAVLQKQLTMGKNTYRMLQKWLHLPPKRQSRAVKAALAAEAAARVQAVAPPLILSPEINLDALAEKVAARLMSQTESRLAAFERRMDNLAAIYSRGRKNTDEATAERILTYLERRFGMMLHDNGVRPEAETEA